MESVFYYPVTLHTTDNSAPFSLVAGASTRLPAMPLGAPVQVAILSSSEGDLAQGLYFWDTKRWRYAVALTEICKAIIEGDNLDLYYSLTADVSGILNSAHAYRNAIPFNQTTLPGNIDVIYLVRTPMNQATGDVASVNGQPPDASGNVLVHIADIPGLQTALNNAGQVKTVSGQTPDGSGNIAIQASDNNTASGTSLISNSGATTGNIKLKRIVAGSNVTLAADANGNLQISASSNVTSVSGQTGAVIIKAQDNNSASGTSLIVGDGSGSGTIKLKTLVAGTNISLAADPNGNIQISAAGGGSVTKVQSVGTGTALVLNDGTSGGIAQIKSLAAGSNITITPDGQNQTLTITANQVLSPATTTTIGGVIVKAGLAVDGSGNLSLAAPTGVNLGGVKAGSGVNIAPDGTISVTATGGVTSIKGEAAALTGAVVLQAGQSISLATTGNTIQINGTGVPEAPNDGNSYVRQNMGWVLAPSGSTAITSVTGQAGTGAVILVESSPPANSAIIKSLVAGANITLSESGGLITVTAAIPGGTVATVNSKTPDGSGNVLLAASDVNALPIAGGTMNGAINMNGTNKITNLANPTVSGDAVNLGTITGLVIDGGVIG